MKTALRPDVLKNVSLLTRYCAIEKPYWLGFLNHYRAQAVSHVHVCVQKQEEYEEVISFGETEGLKIFLHMIPDDCSPSIGLQQLDLSIIRANSDLLMHVDCDEYFVSNEGSLAVQDIFRGHTEPVGLDIPWIMNPVIDQKNIPRNGYYGAEVKQVARIRDILGIKSDHGFLLKPRTSGTVAYTNAHIFGFSLVHYWSRSFRDCLLKIFLNRFPNFKSRDQTEALAKIRNGEVPNRLKILALLEIQPRNIEMEMPAILPFDFEAEEQLIRKYITEDDEKRAYHSFVSYKEKLLNLGRKDIFYPHPKRNLISLGGLLP